MKFADEFRESLNRVLAEAERLGASQVDVCAGDLHRGVGGYPGPDHRMPICCDVMRAAMRPGDEVIMDPPAGKGASLTIRYVLPRPDDHT